VAEAAGIAASTCAQCGTQLAPTLLACPSCHALVHAATLKTLAAQADGARKSGDPGTALIKWRQALELLPAGTRQRDVVTETIAALSRETDQGKPATTNAAPGSHLKRGWLAIAAAATFLLSKAKLLLIGLTKWKTLLSMLVFLGVYVQMWGWKFALGFVVGIYIHEMGHVAALTRYGIEATAPMFIPGLGALVRLKQYPADAREDARVGLAGPVWGLGAALLAGAIGYVTGAAIWLAIAQATAFINLFNLIPFWQLDGGRGFHALSRGQRWIAAAVIAGVWAVSHQGLLVLLLILAVVQAMRGGAEREDQGALAMYAGLIVVLGWLSTIPVAAG